MKFITLALLISSIQSFAHAQTETLADGTKVVEPPVEEKVVLKGSSEYNRSLNKWGIGISALDPDGYSPAAASSVGFEIDYSLSRNVEIGIGYSYANFSIQAAGDQDSNYFSTANSTTNIFYRQFLGNSFYLKGAIAQRDIKINQTCSGMGSPFCGAVMARQLELQVLSAEFSIGNKWQWQNFYIDCNWIGISEPLYYAILGSQIIGGAGNFPSDAYYQYLDITAMTSGVRAVTKFLVGWSF